MKNRRFYTAIGMLLFLLGLFSCEYNFINPERGTTPGPEPGEEVSFQQHVEPIFTKVGCTNCHKDGGLAFSFEVGKAYNSISGNGLVNTVSPADSKLITEGHAQQYYTQADKDLIEQWITEGAKNN